MLAGRWLLARIMGGWRMTQTIQDEAAPVREPYLGAHVIFMDAQGVDHPAFITGQGDLAAGENLAILYDGVQEVVPFPLVPYSGKANKSTWRWPGEGL